MGDNYSEDEKRVNKKGRKLLTIVRGNPEGSPLLRKRSNSKRGRRGYR